MEARFDCLTPECIKKFEEASGVSKERIAQAFKDPASRTILDPSSPRGGDYILKTTIKVNGRIRVFMCFFHLRDDDVAHVMEWRRYQASPDNGYDFSTCSKYWVKLIEDPEDHSENKAMNVVYFIAGSSVQVGCLLPTVPPEGKDYSDLIDGSGSRLRLPTVSLYDSFEKALVGLRHAIYQEWELRKRQVAALNDRLATIDSILSDPDDSYEGTDDADYQDQ